MQYPEEFKELLRLFHLDFFRDRTPEQALTSALRQIGQRRAAVKQFLDELFSQPYDAQELNRLWWAAGADIAPSDAKQIPRLFKLIRDLIDSPNVRSSSLP